MLNRILCNGNQQCLSSKMYIDAVLSDMKERRSKIVEQEL